MKTLLLFCLLCLLWSGARPAAAQNVPNGGFENWATVGTTEYPTNWLTTDVIYASQGVPLALNTVTKSTDRHAGSFAAKLESKTLFGAPFPALLVLGPRFRNAGAFGIGGVPYTGRPASLQFWYKLTLAATDSAEVVVALTRGGGTAAQVVGAGAAVLPNRASYGQFSIPINYVPAQAPDSLRIFVLCGTGTLAASSTLWIDEMALAGTVSAAASAATRAALSIYPNPSASGEFALASLQNPAVATAAYRIYDAQGKLVREQAAVPLNEASGRRVDLRGMPAGVYLLHLSAPDGTLTRKLLIP